MADAGASTAAAAAAAETTSTAVAGENGSGSNGGGGGGGGPRLPPRQLSFDPAASHSVSPISVARAVSSESVYDASSAGLGTSLPAQFTSQATTSYSSVETVTVDSTTSLNGIGRRRVPPATLPVTPAGLSPVQPLLGAVGSAPQLAAWQAQTREALRQELGRAQHQLEEAERDKATLVAQVRAAGSVARRHRDVAQTAALEKVREVRYLQVMLMLCHVCALYTRVCMCWYS